MTKRKHSRKKRGSGVIKKNIKWDKTGNAKFRTSNKNPRGHKHEKNIKNNLRHCRGDRGIKTLLKIKF